MILASIKVPNSSSPTDRLDGELVLVHPDHQTVARLPRERFPNLRQTIEVWDHAEVELREIDSIFRSGNWKETTATARVSFMAPLSRTWALLDGSAFIQHVILVRKARGAEPPEDLFTIPLMYQGASEHLLGPTDDFPLADEKYGLDFESEFCLITDEVPIGTIAANAAQHVKLILLMNDWSMRNLIPRELATGFGFFHGKPVSSFSPFALTPDELGDSWQEGRVHLPIRTTLNGKLVGEPNAAEMHFSFYDLIAHAAKTRALSPGTIIGSGTVSNQDESKGISCLAEKRTLETIHHGAPQTPFLKAGDRVEIEVLKAGKSLFGKMSQQVVQARDY
ncbi:fumarylacetoacetate hydrolase family protein [bacterium]|nr:fumarylacetoacetate hydrolase family protein [bacterium]